jgi:hypothetical protein
VSPSGPGARRCPADHVSGISVAVPTDPSASWGLGDPAFKIVTRACAGSLSPIVCAGKERKGEKRSAVGEILTDRRFSPMNQTVGSVGRRGRSVLGSLTAGGPKSTSISRWRHSSSWSHLAPLASSASLQSQVRTSGSDPLSSRLQVALRIN